MGLATFFYQAIVATIKAVIVSLEIITNGEDIGKAAEASGLLIQVNKFQFLWVESFSWAQVNHG